MPSIKIVALAGGALEIEGKRISDPMEVRKKVEEIAARRPQPSIILLPSSGSVKDLNPLVEMLAKAGVAKVGFIVMPRAETEK